MLFSLASVCRPVCQECDSQIKRRDQDIKISGLHVETLSYKRRRKRKGTDKGPSSLGLRIRKSGIKKKKRRRRAKKGSCSAVQIRMEEKKNYRRMEGAL